MNKKRELSEVKEAMKLLKDLKLMFREEISVLKTEIEEEKNKDKVIVLSLKIEKLYKDYKETVRFFHEFISNNSPAFQ